MRQAIDAAGAAGLRLIATADAAHWPVIARRDGLRVSTPRAYRWPVFLKAENLLNIANQVVVIALLAAGMTVVIITGGIDLSVGSLVAVSAVTTALVIRAVGGTSTGVGGMALGMLAGVLACVVAGLASGALVTAARLPPFIATLGMMQVASGVAYLLARGQSIYDLPDGFVWLGRGSALLGLPNAVVLMVAVYAAGHLMMAHTTMGRYLYAVGGNPEAARLSGVRVRAVLLFAYVVSGALSGAGRRRRRVPAQGRRPHLRPDVRALRHRRRRRRRDQPGGRVGPHPGHADRGADHLRHPERHEPDRASRAICRRSFLGVVILAAVTFDTARQSGWGGKGLLSGAGLFARVRRLRRSRPDPIGHDPGSPVEAKVGAE